MQGGVVSDLVMVVPAVMLAAVGTFVLAWRRGTRGIPVRAGHRADADRVSKAVRARNLGSVLTVIGVAAVLGGAIALGTGVAQLASLEVFIPAVPLLLSMVGLGWFAYVPRFTEQLDAREASLEVRGFLSYAPRKPLVSAIAATTVLTVVVVVFGMSADRGGATIALTGPFPGWRYGILVLIALLLSAATVAAVLLRLSHAARPTDGRLRDADRALRVAAVRAVLTGFTAATTCTAGFVLVMGGLATGEAATGSVFDAAGQLLPANPMLGTVGAIELASGGTALTVAAILLVRTISLLTRPAVFITEPAPTTMTPSSLQGAL